MKVLIDTNVLISAALRDRLPERVVLWVAGPDEYVWLVTQAILNEYVSVLERPKFRLSPDEIQRWSDLVHARTICVGGPPDIHFPRDPKDAPFLAAAIAMTSDYLITGDADLFAAQALVQTKIVSVAQFAQIVGIE